MRAQLQKWGNSLAIRIPKAMAEQTGLETNSPVDIGLENGQIVIKPVKKPYYTLDELVDQITDDNRHEEIDMGKPVGKEIL